MKGKLFVLIVLLIRAWSVSGQAGLQDYLQMAAGFTENNQNLEAIKLCDKLIVAYPENPDVFFLRGINRYVIKECEEAVKDFTRVLELDPNYPDAHLYRAKARKDCKDYFGAMRDYNRAKDKNFSQTVTSLAGDMIKSLFSNKDE